MNKKSVAVAAVVAAVAGWSGVASAAIATPTVDITGVETLVSTLISGVLLVALAVYGYRWARKLIG